MCRPCIIVELLPIPQWLEHSNLRRACWSLGVDPNRGVLAEEFVSFPGATQSLNCFATCTSHRGVALNERAYLRACIHHPAAAKQRKPAFGQSEPVCSSVSPGQPGRGTHTYRGWHRSHHEPRRHWEATQCIQTSAVSEAVMGGGQWYAGVQCILRRGT
jgi:hypothetical protein